MKNGWHLTLLIFAALCTGCLPAILIAQEDKITEAIPFFATPDPSPTVQTGPSGLEQTVGTIATGVAGSITMGGLCWYMVSKALPAKDECNTKQRQEHLVALERQQAQYIAELREERQAHRESVKELVSELAHQREERIEMVRRCTTKLEKA